MHNVGSPRGPIPAAITLAEECCVEGNLKERPERVC